MINSSSHIKHSTISYLATLDQAKLFKNNLKQNALDPNKRAKVKLFLPRITVSFF